jgi:hypothetical protein
VETGIEPGTSHDFVNIPAASYYVRARIKNSSGVLSKWSIPALVGTVNGGGGLEVSTGPGEITVSSALDGIAVFNANVLLDDGNVDAPLEEVSNLTVKQGEGGKLTLEWKDPDDADVDKIEISCTDPVDGFPGQTILKNKEEAVILGLEDGKGYGILVQTVDTRGGKKSAGVYKVVVIGSETPPDVTNLMAAPGAGKVRLTWTNPPDADFDYVEIGYSTNSGVIQTLPLLAKTAQSKTISSLTYGTIYAFTVRTVNNNGNKSRGSLAIASLANVVTDLALDAYITAPIENSAPDRRPITAIQYTGTLEWTKGANIMTDSEFERGQNYRAQVILKANEGYTFNGLTKDDCTYSGATIVAATVLDAGKTFRVRIDFLPAIAGWYVKNGGNDILNDGKTPLTPFATVGRVLQEIRGAYAVATPPTAVWPGKGDNPQSAAIVIEGTLTNSITIDDIEVTSDTYPPIVLRGLSVANPGVIKATGTSPVLTLKTGAQVSLEANLTLTGGNAGGHGGGVKITTASAANPATFTMKGGIISGNTTSLYGGGVSVENNCSFSMSGGSITGNTAGRGGGVFVNMAAFTMSGGTIAENKASTWAAGVILNGAVFTMSGGSISHNTGTNSASSIGGIMLSSGSTFTLNGGTISYNESEGPYGAGGVHINDTSAMIMNGGSIHHNKAATVGGGVVLSSGNGSPVHSPSLTMNGGTISDNEAAEGGGVRIGGTIVSEADSPRFTMKGGTIFGNTATVHGGGVDVLVHGIFTKEPLSDGGSSGVIYGYDPDNPNSNKVRNAGYGIEEDMGHAVYVEAGPKTRETTVLPDQSLDSTIAGVPGGWVD